MNWLPRVALRDRARRFFKRERVRRLASRHAEGVPPRQRGIGAHMLEPLLFLLRRLLLPLTAQCVALRGRQLLEALECVV
jgi:hypothetical protein